MAVVLRVPEVEDPDFVAEMSYAEGAELRLTGSADKTATEPIAAMFAALHAELCQRGTRVLVLDMHGVDTMNARCFQQLIVWVERVIADRRYAIRLRGNPALAWQKHNLAALACFDTELVTVEAP